MKSVEDVALSTLGRFPLPSLDAADDKEGRGRALVIAGGGRTPGAAILTGRAALRAGAGKLQLAASAAAALPLGLAVPEAGIVTAAATADGEFSGKPGPALAKAARAADAVVIGPGMTRAKSAGALACALAKTADAPPFVVDAAAMTGLDASGPQAKAISGRLVLTPHAGEMAKLTGVSKQDVEADPVAAASGVAKAFGAVVVMKGAESFIVTPDGRVYRHRRGVIGLATSGSGDVLAGLIGGLLARGADPVTAAIWGVCVHAQAGARLSRRIGPTGFLAEELLGEIPNVLAEAA